MSELEERTSPDDTSSSSTIAEALKILNDYQRTLTLKAAEQIVENREDFAEEFPARAEEIIERYGHLLMQLSFLQNALLLASSAASSQSPTSASAGNAPPNRPMIVRPSGRPVDATTPLHVGQRVLVEWHNQWYRAEVLNLLQDGNVRIHYIGFGSNWDETVPRQRLQLDVDEEAPES